MCIEYVCKWQKSGKRPASVGRGSVLRDGAGVAAWDAVRRGALDQSGTVWGAVMVLVKYGWKVGWKVAVQGAGGFSCLRCVMACLLMYVLR